MVMLFGNKDRLYINALLVSLLFFIFILTSKLSILQYAFEQPVLITQDGFNK